MAGELVYLDTSGVLAYLAADDDCHTRAVEAWSKAIRQQSLFVMTEYVRLECWSLVQARLGLEGVVDFYKSILPLCRVELVGEDEFNNLADQVLLTRRRQLSLVDLSSFACIRRLDIKRALAFDKHFTDQGIDTPEQWLE